MDLQEPDEKQIRSLVSEDVQRISRTRWVFIHFYQGTQNVLYLTFRDTARGYSQISEKKQGNFLISTGKKVSIHIRVKICKIV